MSSQSPTVGCRRRPRRTTRGSDERRNATAEPARNRASAFAASGSVAASSAAGAAAALTVRYVERPEITSARMPAAARSARAPLTFLRSPNAPAPKRAARIRKTAAKVRRSAVFELFASARTAPIAPRAARRNHAPARTLTSTGRGPRAGRIAPGLASLIEPMGASYQMPASARDRREEDEEEHGRGDGESDLHPRPAARARPSCPVTPFTRKRNGLPPYW